MRDLIAHASALSRFNEALHVNETDLTRWPPDFVKAVLIWASPPEEKGR